MAELILKADFAVVAGGSITWERYCLGLPVIIIAVADNQVQIAEDLAKKGIDYYLGQYFDIDPRLITSCIHQIISNKQRLKSASIFAQKFTDGFGVSKVYCVIKSS
ncbi:hypothetical protein [Halalkalibacter flavus]|uniref:hypothetical protein n=1 Tax=Halalkalibacter flavus TaxID=3090668 RepID=UPI002FC60540